MATTEEERQEYLADLLAERDRLIAESQRLLDEINALTEA